MSRQLTMRLHSEPLIVDAFAGGGGASLGIEHALGRSPDIAINHDAEAIALHAENHPSTRHYCESIYDVDPVEVTGGSPVLMAWFSPDCKHHSRAKGGKPVDKKIRGLAWMVTRWARAVKPSVIFLENVEEFADWGPLLDETGRPDPTRRGFTFRRWWAQLENCGYRVEMRVLRACDFGAPTTRKRLFIIARCDGEAITWPEPTHGPGRIPHLSAATCIDWSLPWPSIFDPDRKPLVDATCRRIARGMQEYVIDAAEPFLVEYHAPRRDGDHRVRGLREPLPVQTTANRFGIVAPTLIQQSYGERTGQAPRCMRIEDPLGTIVAGGIKHALVGAFLAKHFGERATGGWNGGSALGRPMGTVTAKDHHSLVGVSSSGGRAPEVRAFIDKYYGTGVAQSAREPLDTITARDRFSLVGVQGVAHVIDDILMRMLAPRELFRAQGFHDGYRIDLGLSKTAQVRMVGNSVAPPIAAALVRANVTARGAMRGVA